MASYMIAATQNKGKKAAFVVPRVDLMVQMSSTFRSFGINHSYLASGMTFNKNAKTHICSLQTIVKHLGDIKTDVAFLDECFVSGTKVSTLSGDINIEDIKTGDFVYTATGAGQVLAISKRKVYTTSIVRLSNGKEIRCTGNHPFLSRQGWVRAKDLVSGEILIGIQNMPMLWKALSFTDNKEKNSGRGSQNRAEADREACQDSLLLNILLKEDRKCNVDSGGKGKSFKNVKGDRARSICSWWEWASANQTRNNDKGNDGRRVGDATYRTNKDETGGRISASLQDRFRAQEEKDCNRSGWGQPWDLCEASAGQEEGLFFDFPRVESVKIEKSICGTTVYNLEVGGHPSFFANKTLVHNCHWGSDMMNKLVTYFRERGIWVIGMSATPALQNNYGMGDWYDDMVQGQSVRWLIDNKYLADYLLVQPSVKLPKGCIGGDPIAEWEKHAGGRLTIGFCRDKAHGYAMAELFTRYGIPSAFMESDTPADERKRLIAAFADGDLKILFNVYLMQMGFDLASQIGRNVNVRCMLDLQPTGSLTTQMQKNGRALRYDDAGEAVIIDLAGNSYHENHGFPCADREWVLETGDMHKRDVEYREQTLNLINCKNCYKPSKVGNTHCPYCGVKFVVDSKKIKEMDGKLVVITPEMMKAEKEATEKERKAKRMEQGKAQTLDDLKRIAKERGYKSGWVFKQAQLKKIRS